MVYMIAERRPAIEESFLTPPEDWYMNHYRTMIKNMKASNRLPAMAFVFDNSPAINTINEKSKIRFNLKSDTYSFFGLWYDFQKSIDPLADYIRRNMTMVDSITYADHTARCFVDNKKLAETSFQRLASQPDSFQMLNRLAMHHIKEKNYTDAIALLSGPMLKLQPDNVGIYYNIACLFAIQNDQEQAVEWLRRAVEEKGYDGWDKIKTDPDLENIRDSAYYRNVIKNHQ